MPTTAPYHLLILENEAFKAGDVDTGFIVKHGDELNKPLPQKKGGVSQRAACAQQGGCCSCGERSCVVLAHVLGLPVHSTCLEGRGGGARVWGRQGCARGVPSM